MVPIRQTLAENLLRYDSHREDMSDFVPLTAQVVLDVGCGAGGFGRTLRRLLPKAELWAVEPVAEAAEAARQVYDRVITSGFPVETMELDGEKFDAVFMLDVLEHMVEPAEALQAARSLVTPEGVLIASIPNARHFDVWWPLVAHGRWTYTETGLMDRTHLRWFTRSSIQDLFGATGWDVVDLRGINPTRPVGWKAKLLSRLGGRTRDMFVIQFAVTARPQGSDN